METILKTKNEFMVMRHFDIVYTGSVKIIV